MNSESIFIVLLMGAIIGWLAGIIVKGYGFGLFGNIAVGVVGSIIGSWLFGYTGIRLGNGSMGTFIGALVGAIILLLALRIIKKA